MQANYEKLFSSHNGSYTEVVDAIHDEGTKMIDLLNEAPIVLIRIDYYGDYLVPEKNGEIYYTDDRDDAVATACYIYGADCHIQYRRMN